MEYDKNNLKARFENGDRPVGADFADLIESLASYKTLGVADPTVGVAADLGTVGVATDATVWVKCGLADIAWSQLDSDAASLEQEADPSLPLQRKLALTRYSELEYHRPAVNGVTPSKKLISAITKAANAVVSITNSRDYQAGDYVELSDVEGMTEINGIHKVVSSTEYSVTLDVDSTGFSTFSDSGRPYIRRLTDQRTVLIHTGDSFNVGKAGEAFGLGLERALSRREIFVEQGQGPETRRDGALVPSYMDYSYSGGVVHYVKNNGGSNGRIATPDYSVWFTGAYWSVPSGETLEFYGQGSDLVKGNFVEVFYVEESGAGTFDIQISDTYINSGFTSEVVGVDADGVTTLKKATLRRDSLDDIAVRVAVTSGTVRVLGCIISRDDIPEVINISAAVSSLTPSLSFGALNDSIGSGLFAELQPDVFSFCFADEGATEQPVALDDVAGWISTANPNDTRHPVVMVISPPPTTLNSESATAEVSRLLDIKCKTHGFMYYDAYKILGSDVSKIRELGLTDDDGAHINDTGSILLANQIACRLGVPSVLWTDVVPQYSTDNGVNVFNVLKPNATYSFETQSGSNVLSISSTGLSGSAFTNGLASQGLNVYKPQASGGYRFRTGNIDLGDIFDPDMTSDWAVDMWFLAARPSGTQFLFRSRGGSPSYHASLSNLGALTFAINDGSNSASVVAPVGTIPTTTPKLYHMVCTCDVSDTDGLKLYLNNSLVASDDPTAVGDLAHPNSLHIGSSMGSSSYLEGVIYECTLWTKNLTSSIVDALYEKGSMQYAQQWSTYASAGMYAHYNMRSLGAGTECIDATGQGRDGTVSGGVTLV